MANVKPFMRCKISSSLWLILMYVKRCLLEVERSQKGHREVWVLPQLSSYFLASALTTSLPGRACVPGYLHGQLCCAFNRTLLATSAVLLCQVPVLSLIINLFHSMPYKCMEAPTYTCIMPRQASSQSYFDLPFYILIYWTLYPPLTKSIWEQRKRSLVMK